VSSYATIADAETFGLLPGALGLNITVAQIQSNLDAASDEADDFMGARYSLPLLPPIPLSIVRGVVHIARYHILALRGFDETNAADQNVIKMYEAARKFFGEIRNQSMHPNVVESPRPTSLSQPQYADPMIVSQPLQGWMPGQSCPPNGGPQGIIS
jgi:phage gp36-like protein